MLYQPDQDITASDADILVNTVNAVGAMGKGLALNFKTRFPEILPRYQELCKEGQLQPGTIQRARLKDGREVLNFVSKQHWRDPSAYPWVGAGLIYVNRFCMMREPQPGSICLPLPGAGNGWLDPARVQQMIRIYLRPMTDAGIEVRLAHAELAPLSEQVYFAGVGARDTPPHILQLMSEIGGEATQSGMRLRSGGARGADTAFYEGAREAYAHGMQIFLPRQRADLPEGITSIDPVFFRLARNFHPAPAAITPDEANPADKRHMVFRLMARNGNQVFGSDFTNPSNIVICWTKGGKGEGGTGQAIRLAAAANIPVIDLGRPDLQGISAQEVVAMAIDLVAGFRQSVGLPRFEADMSAAVAAMKNAAPDISEPPLPF